MIAEKGNRYQLSLMCRRCAAFSHPGGQTQRSLGWDHDLDSTVHGYYQGEQQQSGLFERIGSKDV